MDWPKYWQSIYYILEFFEIYLDDKFGWRYHSILHFFSAFNAWESISTPIADWAPNFSAAIARIPDPQPKSKTVSPPWIFWDNHFKHRFVVSWLPDPKATPGSMKILVASTSFGTRSAGMIQSRSVILLGLLIFCVSLTQPSQRDCPGSSNHVLLGDSFSPRFWIEADNAHHSNR